MSSIDHADDEPRDVIFPIGIEARHLGGLASDQRAAGFFATPREAFDHRRDGIRHELPGRDVVEKKKRPRALDQNIVDAVADQIVADRVVDAGGKRDSQLGADSVSRRYEHGLFHLREVSAKHTAERTDLRHDVWRERRAR